MRIIIIIIIALNLFFSPVSSDTKQNKVFFDDQALDPVLTMIDQAQSSIYIQMYNFTNTPEEGQQNSDVQQCLLNKLTEKPDKKIELKIIIDNQGANRPPENGGKPYGFPES